MNRIASRTLTTLALLFLAVGLMACGSGGGSPSSGTGTLNLSLTDASTDQYQAIYVTIAEVQVHSASGWQTVSTPDTTYNLLDLVNGTLASLGTKDLATGSYDQLRLILGDTPNANYFIDKNGNAIELKVPSGLQTGIKIVGGFEINAAQYTDLVLDFDAAKSVVRAGNSGKWLLKPTIKILATVANSITGQVSNGSSPIDESLVSAQIYPPGALADANGVFVQNATLTDANGVYLTYVPQATYNVVAVKEGYEPQCAVVDASNLGEHVQDFTLTAAAGTGTVSGTVTGLQTDASATISVLQTMDCGSGEVPVQVDSTNVANAEEATEVNFTFTLPPGDYTLVATSAGLVTQVSDEVTLTAGQDIHDISFKFP